MAGLTYRPALDGVRCVAVVGVLVYHLDRNWLPGGYLGVDVFFVLSGYLITTLLVTERESSGRIALGRFWARRARRLLPASLLVVACVAIWLARQEEFVRAERRGDLLAAVLNVANWRLIATGESYFEGFATPSPLRHFWSLAIEEQFYLLWPLTCGLLLRFGRRSIGAVAAAVGLASAVWMSASFDTSDPSRSYYGTDTRVHQLLIGCLLAVVMPSLVERTRRAGAAADRTLAGVAGGSAALLAAAFVWLADDVAFYYRGGAVAVAVVTVGIIVGIELRQDGRFARVLGCAPAAAVGRVSYGLYVWHWPIFVWMPPGTWGLGSGVPISAARLAVTVAVAVVSYHLVEQPIRRTRRPWWSRPRHVAAASFSAIGAVALLIVGVTWRDEIPAWAAGGDDRVDVITGDSAVDDTPVVAVVGDSVAVSLMPGLTDQAAQRRWTLVDATRRGCPLTLEAQALADGRPADFNPDCAANMPSLLDEAVTAAPDVVIWHDLQSSLDILHPTGDVLVAGSPEWTERVLAGWQTLLDRFREAGSTVMVVTPPWRSPRAADGCGDDSYASRCQELTSQDEHVRAVTATFLDRNADDPGVVSISLDSQLCPNGPPCPDEVDGLAPRLLGRDRTHFTEEGARWIAPVIAATVDEHLTEQV